MSRLDDAMDIHMAHLVFEERRPFSYRDFLQFEVDGIEHKMAHGTFRNKISRLVKEGTVELSYNSGLGFYTLKGQKFGKPMTPNHMGASALHSDPIVKLIRNLPFEKSALHDIHLRFLIKGSWSLLSVNPTYAINPVSKDVPLPLFRIGELRIRVTIHKTDIVTVVVGCSYAPIAADVDGIIHLMKALTRVEERLTRIVESCCGDTVMANQYEHKVSAIPDHKDWLVTMWHFGVDACTEYTGDKFSATWEVGQHELIRVYTKEFHSEIARAGLRARTKIRIEMQQYPDSTLEKVTKNILQNNRDV